MALRQSVTPLVEVKGKKASLKRHLEVGEGCVTLTDGFGSLLVKKKNKKATPNLMKQNCSYFSCKIRQNVTKILSLIGKNVIY